MKFKKLLSKGTASIRGRREQIAWQALRWKKAQYQFFRKLGAPKVTIWIFGCQRSGTTLCERIFRQDLRSAVWGEFSALSLRRAGTGLSDANTIRQKVFASNANYAVVRPLFESDRALELLDVFPRSVGLWLFRDCPHVVDSMVRKWGPDFFKISRANESDNDGNWRLSGLMEELSKDPMGIGRRERLVNMYAGYWLARNNIPITCGLMRDERMLFLSYEQLVTRPEFCIDRIMRKAALGGVWGGFKSGADPSGIDRPVSQPIAKPLIRQSDQLYEDLCQYAERDFGLLKSAKVFAKKKPHRLVEAPLRLKQEGS